MLHLHWLVCVEEKNYIFKSVYRPFHASMALLHNVCMLPLWEDKFADNLIADRMVTSCAVVGCSIKRVANSKFGFFWLPNVIESDKRSEKLSRDRRKLWLARINRENLTENQLAVKNSMLNVCSNHFISGRPSKFYETCDPDWATSINLGYSLDNGNTSGPERLNRRKRMREFQMHQQQAEIDSKVKKDVEKMDTATSSSNLFTKSEESLQIRENYLTQLDVKQNLILTKNLKRKMQNWEMKTQILKSS